MFGILSFYIELVVFLCFSNLDFSLEIARNTRLGERVCIFCSVFPLIFPLQKIDQGLCCLAQALFVFFRIPPSAACNSRRR